ncbi:hypothetical protein GCM10011613_23660 [Cellvibrio zantedeschiae]|uniref:Uncharacterized protein n=1 Tax=Cellvibrio zantedeschiae TaxID=1237077 RepID=A0ABQ3B867_9GAMM|nr:hypothetical protein [Cellvibrio zantedeschiae]GGY78306.1 hypothetical protein GCM10011613_23660 [Cellvibrio zantedeschiae]
MDESKGLAAAALLVFSMGVISQWAFGFYTASYYDSSAAKNISHAHKDFLTVNFRCHLTRLKAQLQK